MRADTEEILDGVWLLLQCGEKVLIKKTLGVKGPLKTIALTINWDKLAPGESKNVRELEIKSFFKK